MGGRHRRSQRPKGNAACKGWSGQAAQLPTRPVASARCWPQLSWFRTVRDKSRIGIGHKVKGVPVSPIGSIFSRLLRCCEKVHEAACCLAIIFVFERHIDVRRDPQHMQKRPHREACGKSIIAAVVPSEASTLRQIVQHTNRALEQDLHSVWIGPTITTVLSPMEQVISHRLRVCNYAV